MIPFSPNASHQEGRNNFSNSFSRMFIPKKFPTMEELKNVTRQDPRNPKTVKN
jgi:IS30 family transposase